MSELPSSTGGFVFAWGLPGQYGFDFAVVPTVAISLVEQYLEVVLVALELQLSLHVVDGESDCC